MEIDNLAPKSKHIYTSGQCVESHGIEGMTGRKSKMSFCSSSKRPNESAMEFDSVQLGTSTAPGILGSGGLHTAGLSFPLIETIPSLPPWYMAGPPLLLGSSSPASPAGGARLVRLACGAVVLALSASLALGISASGLGGGRWSAMRARAYVTNIETVRWISG